MWPSLIWKITFINSKTGTASDSNGIRRTNRAEYIFVCHMMIVIRYIIIFIVLAGCTQVKKDASELIRNTQPDRELDVEIHLSSPMPAGKAYAYFDIYTGGDQMTSKRKEAGLVFVVRYGSSEFRQTIASCREPGHGSALGGGTERELEMAICDKEYQLISEPGAVFVVRTDEKPGGEQVARFELPVSVRAVSP
ncbi:MAG: hypothetical protein HY753_07300 [Nitrospirae bacterium]|nr:hypothetical protein [Nitrospirota bacterium]